MTTTAKPARAKRVSAEDRLQVIQAAILKKIPWMVHGFSTRRGGSTQCYGGRSLNLGFTKEDTRGNVERNRQRFLLAVGAATAGRPWPLIVNRQVHSDVIHVLHTVPRGPLAGDGLVTNLAGVAIAILTADCLPVLLVDKRKKVVAVFHAGWRGTARRIVEKGAGTLRREFGSRPEDLWAAIGPGIGKCCYAVGEELRPEFESQFAYAAELFHEVKESNPVREKYPLLFLNQRPPGHGDPCLRLHLDLAEANRRQLRNAGIPETQITVLRECTACDTTRFFSHRAERGHAGRMMALAGIVP